MSECKSWNDSRPEIPTNRDFCRDDHLLGPTPRLVQFLVEDFCQRDLKSRGTISRHLLKKCFDLSAQTSSFEHKIRIDWKISGTLTKEQNVYGPYIVASLISRLLDEIRPTTWIHKTKYESFRACATLRR